MQKNRFSKLSISIKSRGRFNVEKKSNLRSPYQRDRDRIVHSTAFRRLKHKTQVFVNTTGDHYRTRITHSLEVAQIARTLAKYFKLNEDLCETLSLAHDLGHTPFGHAGEYALHDCMKNHGGFDHNLQTLRIVMFLENKYLKFQGLNLTIETLDGLLKHNGPYEEFEKLDSIIGVKKFKSKINFKHNTSLEAQIASISDDIAYNNHDIQDGIKAKLFTLNELIEINFFKEIYKSYKKNIKRDNKEIIIYQIIRDSINLMVKDIIKNSIKKIKQNKINNMLDVQKNENQTVIFSKNFLSIEKEIKEFLKTKMYNNKNVIVKNNNGKKIIKKLFKMIADKPRKFIKSSDLKKDQHRSISDYISGMTDRFAIQLYKSSK